MPRGRVARVETALFYVQIEHRVLKIAINETQKELRTAIDAIAELKAQMAEMKKEIIAMAACQPSDPLARAEGSFEATTKRKRSVVEAGDE